jgi:hypothetical protein
MWRERITSYCSSAGYSPGCSISVLDAAERDLGVQLPPDLRAVLTESDGVLGEYKSGLIWPLARIVEDNRLFRTNPDFRDLYMPFGHLLFFADAGNGDQFAFPIQGETIQRPDIFVWDHESDSRTWVAPSLERYVDWWLSGRIQL